ncbi:hypothetical protein B7P43_G06364 [Cryptotermes secundus]|uniref:ENT domain-containing protein n=2 Tax=Cryptotermes secundus TaxID=105785 RepID=A0A2J7QBM9_9NEOP|nr:BRCA2-interacting transcriptional repressor EMSY isoform X3 [Cryptotermes secundus]XP_023715111.1 BRCA2-interacting transcriptional repressor EMSY isoform X3 [Cryptotermes secundus]PNF25978.1 hypothetical protein B7P43_G06364 [Cryptotermes secundus]
MWPMLLDMTRDECKRILRRLELEAYSSLVSALRAQGELSKEKRKLLQDLASTLNISMERHRAEVRRAVNDEKLATIAEHIAGPNTSTDWAIEGRRLIPLMPRLVPQTAFTALANNVANIAAAENARLPPPANTVKKNPVPIDETPACEPSVPEATKTPQRSVSPVASNMVSSIQLKKEEEDEKSRKRRRSLSVEGPGVGQLPSPTLPPSKVPNISIQQQPPSRTVAFPMGVNPVKITLTTTPGRSTVTTTTSASTTQKVIIVSSSTAAGSPSILQRSLSVPIVKTVSATCSSNTLSQQPRGTSLIINNQTSTTMGAPAHPGPGGVGNIVTISTNPNSGGNLTATTVSIGGIPTTAYITSPGGVPKIRPKSVQLPAKPRARSGSIVIPMTPNQLASGTAGATQTLTNLPSVQGVQLKTAVHSSKSSLHIKQDSTGMKIMPMSSVGSATKILPKPSFSSSGQAPVYVMSATTASVSMVTRTVPTSSSPRVMTVNSASVSSSSHIRPTGSTTFITKSTAKPIQALHISAQNPNIARPTGGKPNVIVVQKGSASGFSRGVTLSHGGKEVVGKVIMSKSLTSTNLPPSPLTTMTVQKPTTVIQPSGSSGGGGQQALNLPVSSTQGNVIVLDLSQEQLSKNSVLAEILQASGILSDSGSSSSESAVTTTNETSAKEWIQMDIQEKHAVNEVETSEPHEEETRPQNPASPMETIAKAPVGEMSLPVDMAGGRVVTLEEAVELLGQSDTAETRALLTQAGIQVTETVPSSHQVTSSSRSSIQNACNINLHQVVQQDVGDSGSHEVMEVIGELDPQTGIYSIHQPAAISGAGETSDSSREASSSAVRIVSTSSASGTMDIFSTALASADINLDTFQYIEDGMEQLQATDSSSNAGISECSDQSKQVLHYPQSTMVVESVNKQASRPNEQVLDPGIDDHLSNFLQPGTGDSTAVTVEPSNMDTSGMHIEDFSSQKVQGQDIT